MRMRWHGDYLGLITLTKNLFTQLCGRILNWETSDFLQDLFGRSKPFLYTVFCLSFLFVWEVACIRFWLLVILQKTEKVLVKWYHFSEGASESLNHLLFHCCPCLEIGALQALGMLSWMLGLVEVSVGGKWKLWTRSPLAIILLPRNATKLVCNGKESSPSYR